MIRQRNEEQMAENKKKNEEFLKHFQQDVRAKSTISSVEETVQKSKATAAKLRDKAAKILKQFNETMKSAYAFDKENQKREKELRK